MNWTHRVIYPTCGRRVHAAGQTLIPQRSSSVNVACFLRAAGHLSSHQSILVGVRMCKPRIMSESCSIHKLKPSMHRAPILSARQPSPSPHNCVVHGWKDDVTLDLLLVRGFRVVQLPRAVGPFSVSPATSYTLIEGFTEGKPQHLAFDHHKLEVAFPECWGGHRVKWREGISVGSYWSKLCVSM